MFKPKNSKPIKKIEKIEDPRVGTILKELDILQTTVKSLSTHTHQDMLTLIKDIKSKIPNELMAGLGVCIENNQIINTDPGSKAINAYSKVLKVKLEEMFTKFKTSFDAVSTALKIVSTEITKIKLVEHTHPNMEDLDLISDGLHSGRIDNPHHVTCSQLDASPMDHTHSLIIDPDIEKLKTALETKADKDHKHKDKFNTQINKCLDMLSKLSFRIDTVEDKLTRFPNSLLDLDNDVRVRIIKKRNK